MESSLVNDQVPSPSSSCLRFSFDEIKRATNNFAKENCLKDEAYAGVFLGEISEKGYSGKVLVEFLNIWPLTWELREMLITPLHHPNIISPVGFCNLQDVMIVVYESMPNGSLYDYIYTNQDNIPRLTVEQRLEICIGVAKGLCYLHSGTDSNIIHGDIKTETVFLDASLVPKISSVSKSKNRVFERTRSIIKSSPAGDQQLYLAPEAYSGWSKWGYTATEKLDVYAFGLLLLEVLCERPNLKRLLVLALPFVMKGELSRFTPEYVEKYISPECARRCEKLIIGCLEFQPDKRPDMNQVLSELELTLKLQKQYQDANDHDINFQASSSKQYRSKSLSLVEIKRATKDFSTTLGEGGFAKVYYGKILVNGEDVEVAMKRMTINPEQGFPAFEIERKLLLACDHVNIISLVGYCDEKDEMILVYEFMQNGSLYDHIYKHSDRPPMNIEQRLKICIGVAEGLTYLHSRKDYNIIHSDLKTDNILLDANFVPKISDFGLSRTRDVDEYASAQVTQRVHGTAGYIAPECYEANYQLSRKADVYAFGVVLLEVICEKPAWENLIIWAQPFLFKGELPTFVPEHLRKNISPECSRACINLIRHCLDNDPNNRPSMSDVIADLDFALTLQMNPVSYGQKRQPQAIGQQIFSMSDMYLMTNDFHYQNRVTWKEYRRIYRGEMSINVAVKHMTLEKEIQCFQNEIDVLSACHHTNIISLLGYCDEVDQEKMLVLEFTPNGSLYDCLFGEEELFCDLTAEQRLEICYGVAKGLNYLHSGNRFTIVHGDLKTDNIFLGRDFVAKISGFELSTKYVAGLSDAPDAPLKRGTKGYLAPECWALDYKVNPKADVYSFGVVFLEVLCERDVYWTDDLVPWALPSILRGELQSLMPEYLKICISPECARACGDIIGGCLENDPDKRPSMNQVVDKLESALNVQNARVAQITSQLARFDF